MTVEELISAASRGDVNAACTILAAGDVEVNGTDPYGYTAVFKAATRGHTEVRESEGMRSAGASRAEARSTSCLMEPSADTALSLIRYGFSKPYARW